MQLFEASCSLGNAANLFFAAYLQAQLVSKGPPFSHGTFSRVLDGNEGNMEEIGGSTQGEENV